MAFIKLNDVSVEFSVRVGVGRALRGFVRRAGGEIDRKAGIVHALNDISIEINKGERVGLIGHNGAGKSTLLRTMSGIYAPKKGTIEINGNISALFHASAGMEPDDTGYQNIVNCGLFLGMTKKEVLAKVDEIAKFSGLGEYLDMPVRVYSAGMGMRLSFSIATSINPQILLVDEALGTGDAQFADKAQKRIVDLAERSSILVMASHSPGLLSAICNRGIFLEQGRIMADGPITEVIAAYHQSVAESAASDDEESGMRMLQLVRESVQRGETVPIHIEELALWHAIKLSVGDPAMLQRLCKLLSEQGKDVPVDLEIETLEAVLKIRPNEKASIERLEELRKIKREMLVIS
ncbi:MAG: ABC transporter ATP-binding protein [Parvibaculum sp.]|nr:ABC transporter ATP-binding protein [Parvibaculum sp.]